MKSEAELKREVTLQLVTVWDFTPDEAEEAVTEHWDAVEAQDRSSVRNMAKDIAYYVDGE